MGVAVTKTAAIPAVLNDGPATTGEVACQTRLSSRNAGTHLRDLFQRGRLTRSPFQKTGPGHHDVWLWSLRCMNTNEERGDDR